MPYYLNFDKFSLQKHLPEKLYTPTGQAGRNTFRLSTVHNAVRNAIQTADVSEDPISADNHIEIAG